MSESTSLLDPDERLRSLDPFPDSPSDTQINAALERVLTAASTGGVPRTLGRTATTRRRRIVTFAGAAAAAAVAAFVVVNVLPASQSPDTVNAAWAKSVVAHTAAVVSGTGPGVLHVLETISSQAPGGTAGTSRSYTVESWQQQASPYTYWQTVHFAGDVVTTTLSDDVLDRYDSASNTLQELHHVPALLAFGENNPAYRTAFLLLHNQDPAAAIQSAQTVSSSAQPLESFSDLIAALLTAPGVSVTANASVNGESAIKIVGESGHLTLFVQPSTYTPLELVIASGSGAATATVTTSFSTYETLPAGSVSPPNLSQMHPTAHVDSLQGPSS